MKEEKSEIQMFQPKLDDIPGWHALSAKKQGELYEHTTRSHQFRQMEVFGEFGNLLELYQIEKLLENEEMQMKDYMVHVYSDRSNRTVDRKLATFREIAARLSPKAMEKLLTLGPEVLIQFERIASSTIGRIRNALMDVPVLPASTDKDLMATLKAVDEKLYERRQTQHQGKPLRVSKSMTQKMATNALIHYMRLAELKTSADKRDWLVPVNGWAMEAEAISGTLRSIKRRPIPDGVIIRRGRPTMTLEEKRKAREAREAKRRAELAKQ